MNFKKIHKNEYGAVTAELKIECDDDIADISFIIDHIEHICKYFDGEMSESADRAYIEKGRDFKRLTLLSDYRKRSKESVKITLSLFERERKIYESMSIQRILRRHFGVIYSGEKRRIGQSVKTVQKLLIPTEKA